MTTSKKNAGYSINHEDQTITITKDYAKRSSVPGSKEFRELSKLHAAFPEYTIQRRTATITANKEKHNGLTIDRMEAIITAMVKDKKEQKIALDEFKRAKTFYKDYQNIDFSILADDQKEATQTSEELAIAS